VVFLSEVSEPKPVMDVFCDDVTTYSFLPLDFSHCLPILYSMKQQCNLFVILEMLC